ncbi:hypothetical protein HY491_01745 [Candidatus Woesearchaeota archaeon]|nr:hypothetical protein [Candidatus Woesearchaeota archaeon]
MGLLDYLRTNQDFDAGREPDALHRRLITDITARLTTELRVPSPHQHFLEVRLFGDGLIGVTDIIVLR